MALSPSSKAVHLQGLSQSLHMYHSVQGIIIRFLFYGQKPQQRLRQYSVNLHSQDEMLWSPWWQIIFSKSPSYQPEYSELHPSISKDGDRIRKRPCLEVLMERCRALGWWRKCTSGIKCSYLYKFKENLSFKIKPRWGWIWGRADSESGGGLTVCQVNLSSCHDQIYSKDDLGKGTVQWLQSWESKRRKNKSSRIYYVPINPTTKAKKTKGQE